MRTHIGAANLAAILVAAVVLGTPAYAHHGAGGPKTAELVVNEVSLEPAQQGWRIGTTLRDATSGEALAGFAVEARGSADGAPPVGPVALADPDGDGHYEGSLPLSPGSWALTIAANELPGGEPGKAFSRTWNVALHAGKAVHLGRSAPTSRTLGNSGTTDDDDGGGSVPPVLALAGAGGALAVAGAWLAYRRLSATAMTP